MSTNRAPTLGDIFQQSIGASQSGVRVCLPGIVKTLPVGGRANIAVAVSGDRNGVEQNEPVLLSVPILGSGSLRAGIAPPVLPGDPVLLIFADRDLDRWKAAQGLLATKAATPRGHDLTDCIAVPVLVGTATLELWSAFALLVSQLATSIGVAPGAPQTFAPACAALLARLLAAGIIPG